MSWPLKRFLVWTVRLKGSWWSCESVIPYHSHSPCYTILPHMWSMNMNTWTTMIMQCANEQWRKWLARRLKHLAVTWVLFERICIRSVSLLKLWFYWRILHSLRPYSLLSSWALC
jgi:hypothetical protein